MAETVVWAYRATDAPQPKVEQDLHSYIVCKQVWMPEEGIYFCDADCITQYNCLL